MTLASEAQRQAGVGDIIRIVGAGPSESVESECKIMIIILHSTPLTNDGSSLDGRAALYALRRWLPVGNQLVLCEEPGQRGS